MADNDIRVVKFEEAKDKTPMAIVDGKIAFPDKRGEQPKVGEV
jgi:hypothetical protein